MKAMIVVISCLAAFWFCYSKSGQPAIAVAHTATVYNDSLNFKTNLQPMLVQHCSPCHFPGGKMYEKMPFDKGITILQHAEGILRRFSKQEKELLLLKKFIAENKTVVDQ